MEAVGCKTNDIGDIFNGYMFIDSIQNYSKRIAKHEKKIWIIIYKKTIRKN